MKIVSWNCRDKFHSKREYATTFGADILIVPESRKAAIMRPDSTSTEYSSSSIWIGEENNKGLGILSFGKYKATLAKEYNPDFKLIAPVWIDTENLRFLLIAVWTHPPYVKQLLSVLQFYEPLIRSNITIVAGDFNSNSYWDSQNKKYNHTAIVTLLRKSDIDSVYHHHFKEIHGKETINTHRHARSGKDFHIDYCFASKSLLDQLENVEIGEIWNSDHAPLIVTFQNSLLPANSISPHP